MGRGRQLLPPRFGTATAQPGEHAAPQRSRSGKRSQPVAAARPSPSPATLPAHRRRGQGSHAPQNARPRPLLRSAPGMLERSLRPARRLGPKCRCCTSPQGGAPPRSGLGSLGSLWPGPVGDRSRGVGVGEQKAAGGSNGFKRRSCLRSQHLPAAKNPSLQIVLKLLALARLLPPAHPPAGSGGREPACARSCRERRRKGRRGHRGTASPEPSPCLN